MFLDTRLGNTPQWSFHLPRDFKMRVPDVMLKCVVFLGRPIQVDGQDGLDSRSTAFIVSVPLSDRTSYTLYLVASKHSADSLEGKDFGTRLNLQDRGPIAQW